MPKYRDEEFTVPYEMMVKEDFHIDIAGIRSGIAEGTGGHKHEPNLLLEKMNHKNLEIYDALVIPGGPESKEYLWDNEKVLDTIKYFHENKKLIASICYAVIPVVQAKILRNKHATVFPTREARDILEEYGVKFSKDGCVVLSPERIITAQGPKFAKKFGQAIINFLKH